MRFLGSPGTTEFEKRWNPKPGDIVSFKHHGFLLSSGRPKLPTLSRLRPDLTWDTVTANWRERKPTRTYTGLVSMNAQNVDAYIESTAPALRRPGRPKQYWRDIKNRQAFLAEIGRKLGLQRVRVCFTRAHVRRSSYNTVRGLVRRDSW